MLVVVLLGKKVAGSLQLWTLHLPLPGVGLAHGGQLSEEEVEDNRITAPPFPPSPDDAPVRWPSRPPPRSYSWLQLSPPIN